ncbi:MAG: hypothetical protein LBC72_00835, partial [Spirochaetaceae bacterium]|nr:hypothetical protein [Spirochaetaceae bacterium]
TEESLQSNAYLARSFANYAVVFDVGLKMVYQREKEYEKIKPADIQTILRRLLAAGDVTLVMYPQL